jgi:hypothetical protein
MNVGYDECPLEMMSEEAQGVGKAWFVENCKQCLRHIGVNTRSPARRDDHQINVRHCDPDA